MFNKPKIFYQLAIYFTILFLAHIVVFNAQATSATIIVEANESVNIGRSFDVNFNLDCAVEISAFMFTIEYDPNYLSFKDVQTVEGGEVKFYSENSVTTVICLFSNGVKNGNFITLQFTAKSGNDSSSQIIYFRCNQAVDQNLNDVSFSMSESISIDIFRSSDNEGTVSSIKSGSTSNSASSKSKSATSSKSGSSSKSLNTSSGSSSSKRIYADTEEGYILDENKESRVSLYDFDSDLTVDYLNGENSNLKYIFAGAGLATAFFFFVFIAYRWGQMSMERNKADSRKEDENTGQSKNNDS